ncbi:Merlin [Dirofilaria immitis]|nr:Merlin [Dirofilaria immitis]
MSAKRARLTGSLQSPEKKKQAEEHIAKLFHIEVQVTSTRSLIFKEFYEREDREALSMTMASIEESFLEYSQMLKQKLLESCCDAVKPLEVSNFEESLLSLFLSLRRLNRLAQYRNRQIRDQVNRERTVVEERFLQLQNIRSEIEHLQKEIDRCYDFRSADEDIEMVSLEEFYANAPASISQEEITRKDQHRQHLARLNWEMEERKNLVGTLQEREGRKNVLITDITTKEHRLKSLKPRIEAVIEAARPVQELMGLTSSPIDVEKERVLSLLPQELSVIAIQVEAYCDIVKEAGIILKCKGDYESAVKFLENRQRTFEVIEDVDDEESQDDLNEKQSQSTRHDKRRHMSMKELIAERQDAIVAPHPIHIEMEIACQDDMCVTLVLQFIPGLRSVGVMAKLNQVPTLIYGNTLFDVSFLPNYLMATMEVNVISVTDLEPKIGRFYAFAQKMAGINDEVPAKNSQLCEIIHSVVGKIRSRIRSRCVLARITHSLHALKVFDDLKNRNDFPDNVCAKLTSFRMITADQFFEYEALTEEYRNLIEFERKTNIDKQFYFSATVERDPGAKLHALIYVDIKYPKIKPIYILSFTLDDTEVPSSFNNDLIQVERVLNAEFAAYVTFDDPNSILEAQMAFLVSRFDILLESNSAASGSGQFTREHLFSRPYRQQIYDNNNNNNNSDTELSHIYDNTKLSQIYDNNDKKLSYVYYNNNTIYDNNNDNDNNEISKIYDNNSNDNNDTKLSHIYDNNSNNNDDSDTKLRQIYDDNNSDNDDNNSDNDDNNSDNDDNNSDNDDNTKLSLSNR